MRNPIVTALARLWAFLNRRTVRTVVILVAAPVRTDPWTRPWTSPGKEQAQAILQARTRRRLVIAPYGIRLDQPVAVRAARPGHAWTWVG
ncbi:hypothetical protein [Streptomyces qinzhouensis]|uniref:Uncharacterized protein n=1 Tax=Streptomyces qinzhouensis TaxID=2599401 RepID=A0A5B8JKM0_9ACTN|nr:hypothetical protein [Streptomyces qinzhouensis]QDY78063.1 hypothetical protein FQU76_17885 [Streptomyces qinzhouensis]